MSGGNGTMRAAALERPGSIRIASHERPDPGPGEVRVRLEGSGVCASNLEVWRGRPWFDYPLPPGAPGHEGWGRVDAVGTGVEGFREGERVASLGQRAYAEYDLVRAEQLVPIPEELGEAPFPGEALGCAMNIFARSGIETDQTVAIVGVGFLGAILTRLSAHAGARVIAISRRTFALDLARRQGAAETLQLEDHAAVVEAVGEMTGGSFCDRVIEATGKQEPLDLSGELTRERGRLVIAGFHQGGRRSVDLQLWNWRGLDVINAHERDPVVYRHGVERAIDAVRSGHLDVAPLITHTLPLDRLDEALDLAEERPDGFLKAVVVP